MGEQLRIMTIVCHPADAIDHAGGTMCLHAERGDEVSVVVCTHGVDTHHHQRNEALRFESASTAADLKIAMDEKEAEVLKGMAILGVHDVRFLRFPDELVLVNQALIEAIAAQIADVQPHILILHNPSEEPGNGHGETAQAALGVPRAGERAPQIPEEVQAAGLPDSDLFLRDVRDHHAAHDGRDALRERPHRHHLGRGPKGAGDGLPDEPVLSRQPGAQVRRRCQRPHGAALVHPVRRSVPATQPERLYASAAEPLHAHGFHPADHRI